MMPNALRVGWLMGLLAAGTFACAVESDGGATGELDWEQLASTSPEYFSVCEDECLECVEVHRCGMGNELRLHCVSGGSGCTNPTPVACMCCEPNACRVGTIHDGVCVPCPDGQLCDDLTNTCYTPESELPPPKPPCPWPERMCDGECTNVRLDDDHCGSCDNACAWNQICDGGQCVGGGIIFR